MLVKVHSEKLKWKYPFSCVRKLGGSVEYACNVKIAVYRI